MSGSALVVIDMQEFFFEENKDVDKKSLAANCGKIIGTAREAGLPVIHVVTLYRDDKVDWPRAWAGDDESWCSNLVRGHELSKVVSGVATAIDPEDFLVEKRRFSAFYNTNLDDILRSLGCEGIYLIGYSADVCIRFTSVDAYNRGYAVTLISEGIDSFRESREASTKYLDWLIDARCISLEDFGQSLDG
ncbi:cysteine hydrolase [Catenulispora yoronensis]|uniref:Cysteine hydrolase n=1 Tax=Catenulispora yoronensis TaxID=450799 RepID=A0ABN2TUK5_9ACTN